VTTLYPIGYGTSMVTLERMRQIHEPKMHPEYARRLFPYLEHRGGLLGIGGGWRSIQPDRPGFAPDGKSFHQNQTFASGVVGYCAVDLVAVNTAAVMVPAHRAPTWAETATAPEWGLHTFILNPPEPWHMQPIEIRGWQSWVDAGRKDPVAGIPLPNDPPPDEEDEVSKPISVIKPKPGWRPDYDGGNGPATFVRYGSGVAQRAVVNDEAVAVSLGAVVVLHDSVDWYNDLLRQSGSTLPPM
jgi:hypothetical protein